MASFFGTFCSAPDLHKSLLGQRMSEDEFMIVELDEPTPRSVRSIDQALKIELPPDIKKSSKETAAPNSDEDDTSSEGSYSPRDTFFLDGPESIPRDFSLSNQGSRYYESTDAIEISRVECRAHIQRFSKPSSNDCRDASNNSDHDRAADNGGGNRANDDAGADLTTKAADKGGGNRAKDDAGGDLTSEPSRFQQDEENESTTASTFEEQESSKKSHIYGLLPETEEIYRKAITESIMPCKLHGEWKNVKSSKPYVSMRSCRKPGQSKFYLHLITEIAAPITHCMSIGYEQDIFPKWNPIVIKNAPVGKNTIPYSVAHWEKSIAAGLLKSDSVHENFRWLDMQKGIYVEHTRPLSADSELQFKPRKGFKREEMLNYFMMIPIKEGKATLWISTSKVDMGINVYDFMADRILPLASNETQDAIERTSLMISDPKKGCEWMKRIEKDETGMYALLNKVVERSTSHQKQIGREWSVSNVPTVEDLLDF